MGGQVIRLAIISGLRQRGLYDERLDFLKAAEVMRRVISGEQVIMYAEAKRHNLETYRPRLKEAV